MYGEYSRMDSITDNTNIDQIVLLCWRGLQFGEVLFSGFQ